MNQRKRKLLAALVEQLDQIMNTRFRWFCYERQYMPFEEVVEPLESMEELDMRQNVLLDKILDILATE